MSKTRDDEIYEEGVHDGQNSDLLGSFVHSVAKSLPSSREQEIYEKGFDYGEKHKYEKK